MWWYGFKRDGIICRPDRKPTRGRDGMLAKIGNLRTAAKRYWRSAVWATVAAAALFIGNAPWAQGQTPNAPLRLIKIIPINGTAARPTTQMFSFDISWVDPTTG